MRFIENFHIVGNEIKIGFQRLPRGIIHRNFE